jgi:hypothetical protein
MTVVIAFIRQTESGEYEHTKFSQAYLSMPGAFFRLMCFLRFLLEVYSDRLQV